MAKTPGREPGVFLCVPNMFDRLGVHPGRWLLVVDSSAKSSSPPLSSRCSDMSSCARLGGLGRPPLRELGSIGAGQERPAHAAPAHHRLRHTLLSKLERDEAGGLLADVGESVSEPAGDPLHITGLQLAS